MKWFTYTISFNSYKLPYSIYKDYPLGYSFLCLILPIAYTWHTLSHTQQHFLYHIPHTNFKHCILYIITYSVTNKLYTMLYIIYLTKIIRLPLSISYTSYTIFHTLFKRHNMYLISNIPHSPSLVISKHRCIFWDSLLLVAELLYNSGRKAVTV